MAAINKKSNMYFIPSKAPITPLTNGNTIRAFNEKKQPRNFLKVMLPIIFTWRLVGRCPYTLSGRSLKYNIFSFWTVYTIIIITISTYFQVIFTFKDAVSPHRDSTVKTIFLVMALVQMILPLFVWIEISQVIEYFSKWAEFEDALAGVGVYLVTNRKKWSKVWTFLNIPVTMCATFLDCYFNHKINYLPCIILVHATTTTTLIVWFFTCSFMKLASNVLLTHLKQILFKRFVVREDVAKCRTLWLMLSNLCSTFGYAMGPTFITLIMLTTIMSITTAYAILLLIRGGFNLSIQFTLILFLLFFAFTILLLSICELGQRCSNAIGQDFIKTIIQQSFTKFDKETEVEMSVFLKSISSEYPSIVLSGYVTVNRRLFISLLKPKKVLTPTRDRLTQIK